MPTPKAVDACVLIADILADAIVGMSSADIFRTRALPLSQAIAAFNPGASRGRALDKRETHTNCRVRSRLTPRGGYDDTAQTLASWERMRTRRSQGGR